MAEPRLDEHRLLPKWQRKLGLGLVQATTERQDGAPGGPS